MKTKERKSWEWFVISEWLLLPSTIIQSVSCYKPHLVYALMLDIPDQNKILPYRIIMWILKMRIKRNNR